MKDNSIELVGAMKSAPEYSHSVGDEIFYTFPMEIMRLSGYCDTVNVILNKKLLNIEPGDGDKLSVIGEIHSYNNKSGVGNRLIIYVFARQISTVSADDKNAAEICGTVCREPNYRITPLGRDICDLTVAVNRRYGKSDYIPCIAWGSGAYFASMLSVGQKVCISGRLQSREYVKKSDDTQRKRVAYELSISDLNAE